MPFASNRAKLMQAIVKAMLPHATVSIRYPVCPSPEAWVLPEGTVPEAPIHDEVAQTLKLVLCAWASRSASPLRVCRNLAIRWLEQYPRTGIDPDVCVLSPPPADLDEHGSLCLWKPDHAAPTICFEIVSVNHPHKDYLALQDRYAALGTSELVVFDPLLAGPKALGGPVALQLWRRHASGAFERLHFGDSPVYSRVLDAWILAEGRGLVIADDRTGQHRWQTEAELNRDLAARHRSDAERARSDAERARSDAERERAAREELERKLAELKAGG